MILDNKPYEIWQKFQIPSHESHGRQNKKLIFSYRVISKIRPANKTCIHIRLERKDDGSNEGNYSRDVQKGYTDRSFFTESAFSTVAY